MPPMPPTSYTAAASAAPLVDLTAIDPPFSWRSLFGRTAPVELEIGSGKGRFLLEAAQRWPERDFLGVETAGRYLRRSVDRVRRAGLRNVRLARTDGRDLLTRWIPPGGLRRIHIYFPDPWPKRRHRKRRFINPPFPRWAARALEAGGEILIGTDHEDYFCWIQAVMGLRPGFERRYWNPLEEEWILTNYAVKWAAQGRRLYWMRYAWRG
ncbi:MAG: tRNA (guanosine(46)-N7)-methyltransferase TrmB [Candidatus Eisenbacteria bacterium]|nr:tRNA (guanosine(46)-N7)-methyltransferase TrmB [Candidatus Eisenbacteria bacterium]